MKKRIVLGYGLGANVQAGNVFRHNQASLKDSRKMRRYWNRLSGQESGPIYRIVAVLVEPRKKRASEGK